MATKDELVKAATDLGIVDAKDMKVDDLEKSIAKAQKAAAAAAAAADKKSGIPSGAVKDDDPDLVGATHRVKKTHYGPVHIPRVGGHPMDRSLVVPGGKVPKTVVPYVLKSLIARGIVEEIK